MTGKFFTRQKGDENAQSARESSRELASEGHVFVCHVLVTGGTIRIEPASVTGLSKGAPGSESRTGNWLVSPAAGPEKKKGHLYNKS